DILLFGMTVSELLFTQQYRNEIAQPNNPPTAPGGLMSAVSGNTVELSWSPSTDDHTPSAGLTYNVRIGAFPGVNVMSPMATPDGRRLVTARGNVDHNLSWSVTNLTPGTFTWQVQAIDGAGVGSAF